MGFLSMYTHSMRNYMNDFYETMRFSMSISRSMLEIHGMQEAAHRGLSVGRQRKCRRG